MSVVRNPAGRSPHSLRTRLPIAAFAFSALALGVACSDDGGGASSTPDGATTTLDPEAAARTTTTLPLDTPTTFIADCAQMPEPAALSAIVGIPLADGQVVEAGTCQFLGLNDQTRVLTLTQLTDPADQASFTDLVSSLGPSTPLADPTLANAMIDPTSLVYITANNAIYSVRTLVNDTTPAEQVPLSVAVLHLWLGV